MKSPVAVLALLAGCASAQVGPIQSQLNGFCMDVPGFNYQPGTRLLMYRCNGGANQAFRWTPGGPLVVGGLCVDALGGNGVNLDPIALWGCTGGANQQWAFDGQNRLVGINGRCIDIEGGSQAEGAGMVLYDCHAGANQKWYAGGALGSAASRPDPLVNPRMLVATAENERKPRCLDTQSRTPGSPLVTYDCHGGESQLFQVNPGGTINLFNQSLCLDAKGGAGNPLVFEYCNGSDSQRFFTNNLIQLANLPQTWDESEAVRVQTTPGQLQTMDKRLGNPCIDIEGGRTGNNARALMWTCSGELDRPWNQRFAAGNFLPDGRALVFSRWFTPVGMGHIAWAIRIGSDRWLAGAVDGASSPVIGKDADNGWWMVEFQGYDAEDQVVRYMTGHEVTGHKTHKYGSYTHLKDYQVGRANPAAALAVIAAVKHWGYGLSGNNCMDVVQKVLAAYGLALPDPGQAKDPSGRYLWVPNTWFQNLPGAGRTL